LGELGASNLLRRALYYLSLATSTFCVGYFWDRVLFIPRLAWITIPLFVLPWDDRHVAPCPTTEWDGSLKK
jgi:hypothetical protein